ncbi:hypothetical protein MVEN_00624400 [Mycena venus]|uniref:Uncharacterized protein n=1 Tax=Mycena venus TaxID=2733690 RepID=A0A8H6YQL9_9AGAR|nr:hypothetical protein MVEN_00624400 [Mycena venus]
MSNAGNRTPDTHDATSQPELGIWAGSTPRISTTSATPSEDRSAQSSEKAGDGMPQASRGYFGKLTQPALRRLNSALPDDDDETGSTTTDITEVSTKAQAGSVAPSSPGSPTSSTEGEMDVDKDEDDIERSAGVGVGDDIQETPDADSSPFLNQDHGSATKPPPPAINLAPRTHPLAGGEAEHGGVPLSEDKQAEMDDERADGELGPAYNSAEAFKDEDSYSSDEAKEDGTGKRLMKRVKGGAKVVSGRIRGDRERVKEGQDMMGEV